MRSRFLDPGFAPAFLLMIAVVSLINWLYLPVHTTGMMMAEHGPIENVTILLYYIAMLVLWLFRPSSMSTRATLAIQVVLMAMAARELDLHKSSTGMSVLKARFWEGTTPLPQMLEALVFLLPFLAALIYLVLRHGKWLRSAIAERVPAGWTIATILVSLVVSKCADRSLGLLHEWFGLNRTEWLLALTLSIEEPLEMILPVLVVIAVLQAAGAEHARA